MRAPAKKRVEDLLRNICEGLQRTPSAERIKRPDSYRCSPEKVKQRLTSLTPEERKAVMMSRLGYLHEEIAVHMNISVESLRAQIRKAYIKLKTPASESKQE